MHIGITISLGSKKESMWINGIKLNALFLSKALQAAGYKVTVLDTGSKLDKITKDSVVWDLKEYPTKKFKDSEKKLEVDLLIMLGTSFKGDAIKTWKSKKPGRKAIKYHCGNNYVIDMERCFFPKKGGAEAGFTAFQRGMVDEIWYVPQQGVQNRHYYSVLYELPLDKVIPVPFIWDPCFLDEDVARKEDLLKEGKVEGGIPIYVPGKKKENLQFCIFEPNMNVVKNSMVPMLITELWKRDGLGSNKVNLMSTSNLLKNSYWKSLIEQLDLCTPGDVTLNCFARYPVIETLSKRADIVISHQWENPLNYSYLDVLYLQYPLVHNADMIKDAGYYYEGFNIHEGYEQLKIAADTHDSNLEEYNERSEKVLTRYTVYNEGLLDLYKILVDDLMSGNRSSGLSYEYDWKTNLYKK